MLNETIDHKKKISLNYLKLILSLFRLGAKPLFATVFIGFFAVLLLAFFSGLGCSLFQFFFGFFNGVLGN